MAETKRLIKKELKKTKLLESAYSLFMSKGISKTTVDDIVKKADVAKGTFYLYFKDKESLLDHLVISKSDEIIRDAIQVTKDANIHDFKDTILFFVNALIDRFEHNKPALFLLKKNFSWSLVLKEIEKGKNDSSNDVIYDLLQKKSELKDYSYEDMLRLLYIIVEMVGSVCYSSIIKNEPAPIEETRPLILHLVEKMIA